MEDTPIPQPPAPVQSSVSMMTCTFCKATVPAASVFCPNCGKQLKDKELSTTLTVQAGLYIFAAFLPPLGFWPGVKYYRNSDPKAQQIGMWLILISIASTIITLWLTFKFLNIYLNTFNDVLNGTGGNGLY